MNDAKPPMRIAYKKNNTTRPAVEASPWKMTGKDKKEYLVYLVDKEHAPPDLPGRYEIISVPLTTLTSNEDYIKFKIYSGETYGWEAAAERIRISDNQHKAEIFRHEEIQDNMAKKIKDLQQELAVAKEQLATQEDTEDKKVLPFPNPKLKLITGGRPPEWHPRWLDELAVGSVFTVENKQDPNDFIEGLFILLIKTEESAYLKNLNSDNDIRTWVKIQRFCRRYQLVDILDIIDKPEEKHFEDNEKE